MKLPQHLLPKSYSSGIINGWMIEFLRFVALFKKFTKFVNSLSVEQVYDHSSLFQHKLKEQP
jgi:hypothetical protein